MLRKCLILCTFFVGACGDDDATSRGEVNPSDADAGAPDASDQSPTFALQVKEGAKLYGQHCAECHGDSGEGTLRGPPVVGDEAFPLNAPEGRKRDVAFRTALDAFSWASETMPGDDPGSLDAETLLSIFAFTLSSNGIELDVRLDGESAAGVVLNAPGSAEDAGNEPADAGTDAGSDAGVMDSGVESFAEQVTLGDALYGQHCAKCHADDGGGTAMGPPVVGAEAFPLNAPAPRKRDVPFVTALDAFSWASMTMPGDAPGSLDPADMLRIFAFTLDANGVELDVPLDATSAADVSLNSPADAGQ